MQRPGRLRRQSGRRLAHLPEMNTQGQQGPLSRAMCLHRPPGLPLPSAVVLSAQSRTLPKDAALSHCLKLPPTGHTAGKESQAGGRRDGGGRFCILLLTSLAGGLGAPGAQLPPGPWHSDPPSAGAAAAAPPAGPGGHAPSHAHTPVPPVQPSGHSPSRPAETCEATAGGTVCTSGMLTGRQPATPAHLCDSIPHSQTQAQGFSASPAADGAEVTCDPADSQQGAAGAYLSWRDSRCTSSRDSSSLAFSDFKSCAALCSSARSLRTSLAVSCSLLRVLCKSLAMHFSCSTL